MSPRQQMPGERFLSLWINPRGSTGLVILSILKVKILIQIEKTQSPLPLPGVVPLLS